MKRLFFASILSLILIRLSGQNIDFDFSVKSISNELFNVTVNITEQGGESPFQYYLYVGKPFGVPVKEIVSNEKTIVFENLDSKKVYFIMVGNRDWESMKSKRINFLNEE